MPPARLIADAPERTAIEAIDAITDAFADRYDAMLRLRPARDAFQSEGRARMRALIRPFVATNRPIEMVLPGFALKNPNRDKTLGPLPDRAEQAALGHLERFCEAISAVYHPIGHATGCRLTLVADGRVWGDLLGVDPARVAAYGAGLRAMARDSRHLCIVGLEALVDPPTAAALDERHERLPVGAARHDSHLALARARFRHLIDEDTRWPEALDEEERKAHADQLARDMLHRHEALGVALARRFPNHLRLSVHAGRDEGPKYSCRFDAEPPPVGVTPVLPYHGVAVESADGTALEVLHADEARALPGGVTLISTPEGHPWCLRRNP
ncbi:MAG: L-tyrosine/L-tryptophan isonitrile synthase family protein [Myxococcales bacterium]|nr:L-tyrosine/L-tryptophan isonitrile synthase family protein [Myxococcales bacterium]